MTNRIVRLIKTTTAPAFAYAIANPGPKQPIPGPKRLIPGPSQKHTGLTRNQKLFAATPAYSGTCWHRHLRYTAIRAESNGHIGTSPGLSPTHSGTFYLNQGSKINYSGFLFLKRGHKITDAVFLFLNPGTSLKTQGIIF